MLEHYNIKILKYYIKKYFILIKHYIFLHLQKKKNFT